MKLTNRMHDAVKDSEVGKFLDRLIREEVARGGNVHVPGGGNVIQQLWAAFMSGVPQEMKQIEGSSNIAAFGHENGVLTVHFKNGTEYTYDDFPADLHDKWLKAHEAGESVGQFFHRHIKPHYEGKKRETT